MSKILVIDNDEATRVLMQTVLGKAGYDTAATEFRRGPVQSLVSSAFDGGFYLVIIGDAGISETALPRMMIDYAIDKGQQDKILVVSADATAYKAFSKKNQPQTSSGLEEMPGFLRKPFSHAQLIDAVKSVIGDPGPIAPSDVVRAKFSGFDR